VTPTHRATVFVAFAGTGGTPVRQSAGKSTKLPPPATALRTPPRTPAKKRKIAIWMGKELDVPEILLFCQLNGEFAWLMHALFVVLLFQ
jgi:hypothetical protein